MYLDKHKFVILSIIQPLGLQIRASGGYNYMSRLNVNVIDYDNDGIVNFWIEELSDNLCSNEDIDNTITFNVVGCCPNIISDGDFENSTVLDDNRTDLEVNTYNGVNVYSIYEPSFMLEYYGNALYVNGPTENQLNPQGESLIWSSGPLNISQNTDYLIDFYNTPGNKVFLSTVPAIPDRQLNLSLRIVNNGNIIFSKDLLFPDAILFEPKFWLINNFLWNSTSYNEISIEIYQINNFGSTYFDYYIDNISLNSISTIFAEISANLSICENNGAQLNASGGTIYQWSPAEGLSQSNISNPYATPGTTTSYTVTVSDINGCTAQDNITIPVGTPFEADAGISQNTCGLQNIVLGGDDGSFNGAPPYSYSWYSANNSLNNTSVLHPTASPASNTTYYLTVTDSNGCSSTDNVTIYVTPFPPTVTLSGEPSQPCLNSLVNIHTLLEVGIGPFSYEWNNSASYSNLTGVPSGVYSVTVTDVNGCSSNANISFWHEPLTVTEITTQNSCDNDGSVFANHSGGTTPVSYYWTNEFGINVGNTQAVFNLQPGNYFLILTDMNGCSETVDATIEELELPVLSISSENACNSGYFGSAQVLISSYTDPHTYVWSNSATTAEITNVPPGTYSVTVTGINGCSSSASVEIGNLNVDASFKYYPCLDLKTIDLDLALFFPAAIPESDWPLYNFEWDMGNGLTANTPTVIPDYLYEGYYCPQLTVSRDGCVDTQQETVYVNPTGCYCNQGNWDYNNFVINGDNYPDILVQGSNGVSMSNQEIYILKEMIISNNRLTLNNCILHFGPEGRVIVEVGATLISNSTVFTSFENGESCNHMWQGIEVRGTNGAPVDQGEVIFSRTGSSSVIKNAHIGILSGKRNLSYICNCPSGNPYALSASGGRISANNTNFINNGTDIKFTRSIEPSNNNSLSSIRNCNFTCYPELLDEGYDINYPNHYGFGEPSNWQNPNNTFFNPRNPWAGRANELQRSNASIWVHNQTFSNLIAFNTFDNKEDGIISYDSKYTVFDCHFTKMINGISIFNTNPFIDLNHEISLCEFDKIPNDATDPDAEGACIRIDGGMFDFIHDNTFGGSYTNQNLNDHGIRMTNASGFRIIENNFNNLRTGVNISESGNEDGEGGYVGAGLSTTHLNWTGNVYTQCRTNILTSGINDNLKLKCNMCNNLIPDIFDVNFESSGTLANQGSMPYGTWMIPSNKRKFAAGNEFDGTPDPLDPFDETPYYKEIHSSTNYEYFHHPDPFMSIPVPTSTQITTHSIGLGLPKISNELSCPKPAIGNIHIYDDIAIELPEDFDISFDFVTSIGSLNGVIGYLQFEQQQLNLSLDNGNTIKLLSDIQNRVPQGKLKNDLINCSPLSDTVITALIVEYPLSHGNFKNVMQYNLPVSRDVSPYLNERLKTLPQGIVNQLIPLMAENQFTVTPAALQREIEFFKLEKQLYINEIIYRLLDTTINDKAAVVSLLNNIDTWSAKQLLFSDMLKNGEYIQAASFLSNFDRSNSEINDWVGLNEILLSLYSNDKTLYEMDSIQLAFVTDLAYKCPSGRGSSGARSIIHLLFGKEVPACVEMQSRSSKLMIKDVDFVMPDCDAYMEDNFPDPFTEYTLINYYLPEEMTGKIIVNDMFGRIIAEYQLEVGENTLEIINNDWAPGVYSYGMIVNDKAIEFKKMVITQ